PREHAVIVPVTPALQFVGGEGPGNPKFSGLVIVFGTRQRELEILRHDADDGVGNAVQVYDLANDVRSTSVAMLPKTVAQDSNMRAWLVLLLSVRAAEERLDPEHWGNRSRDARSGGAFGLAATREVKTFILESSERGERLLRPLNYRDVGRRSRDLRVSQGLEAFTQHDKS